MSKSLLFAILILSSSFTTILLKLQNTSTMLSLIFFHPFYQTFMMFMAQSFCYFPYFIWVKPNEQTKTTGNKKLSFVQTFVPSFFDLVSSSLLYFSLTILPVSVFQMLRGTSLLIQTFFSVFFNKKTLKKIEIIGIVVMFTGIIFIGLTTFKEDINQNVHQKSSNVMGFILLYSALITNAAQNSYEEYAMKSFEIHPLEFAGLQGFWGVFMYSFILLIFQNVKCHPENDISAYCTVNQEGVWLLENTLFAIEQTVSEFKFVTLAIGIIIFTALYNYSALLCTKMHSFLDKTIIVNARVIVVWTLFLAIGEEKFIFAHLIGYILIVLGAIIFNNLFTSSAYLNELKKKCFCSNKKEINLPLIELETQRK